MKFMDYEKSFYAAQFRTMAIIYGALIVFGPFALERLYTSAEPEKRDVALINDKVVELYQAPLDLMHHVAYFKLDSTKCDGDCGNSVELNEVYRSGTYDGKDKYFFLTHADYPNNWLPMDLVPVGQKKFFYEPFEFDIEWKDSLPQSFSIVQRSPAGNLRQHYTRFIEVGDLYN